MKLDATDLRYITSDEFRVLTATEQGSKNHLTVPTPLIAQISSIRSGGVNKLIGSLAKRGLIARVQGVKYDGYRLTYGGYDYLALHSLQKTKAIVSVGNQIGVGKESDIYVGADTEGRQICIKIHRLGRISFRAIKEKRDYMGKRKSASWMYMSRLAATREWDFLTTLHAHKFPVPTPLGHSRHMILMTLHDSYPLRLINSHPSPGQLYSTLMDLIVKFSKHGLIHCDFNEFNLLIGRKKGEVVVIDFPQCISIEHKEAEWYFNRDVQCIRTFFRRRFNYESSLFPKFKDSIPNEDDKEVRLDVEVQASGWKGAKKGRGKYDDLDSFLSTTKGADMGQEEEDEVENQLDEGGEEEEEEEEEEFSEEDEDEEEEFQVGDEEMIDGPDEWAGNIKDVRNGDEGPRDPHTHPNSSDDDDDDDEVNDIVAPLTALNLASRNSSSSKAGPKSTSGMSMVSRTTSIATRSSDLTRQVQKEGIRERLEKERLYHSRASSVKAGRAKGTKKKNETSARLTKAERGGASDGW